MIYFTRQRNNYNGFATSTTLKLYPVVPHGTVVTAGIEGAIFT